MSPRPHTLVIGGSRGLGRTLVRCLAADGLLVSVISRSEPVGFEDLPEVRAFPADVTDTPALEAALSSAVRTNGPPSGLVMLQRYRGEGDDWAGELATSLTATRCVLDWIGAHRDPAGGGTAIVLIGSAAASFIASEQPVSYHVAKAGITQMVRYYAVAFGKMGVRVNSISPGTMVKDENEAFYREHPELERLYREIVPVGRMGTARDVADLALFLLSDRATFLTGQNIILDGGVSLHWHESLARNLSPLKDLNVTRQPRRDS